jgi:hypothetical protein
MTESELRTRGAQYNSIGNWQAHVEVDGNLISGQNPGSTA